MIDSAVGRLDVAATARAERDALKKLELHYFFYQTWALAMNARSAGKFLIRLGTGTYAESVQHL
jgi:hypothetical protein